MKRLYLGFDVSRAQIGAALDISRQSAWGAVYLIGPPNEASRPRKTETVPRAEHLYIVTKRKSSELAVRFAVVRHCLRIDLNPVE